MTQPITESRLDRHRRKRLVLSRVEVSYRLESITEMLLLAIQQQQQQSQSVFMGQ
jgi:hypothetical protein